MRRTRRGDTEPKKNSLSLTIGPPSDPPNSLRTLSLLVVLQVADGLVVYRVEHEALDRTGAERAAVEVVVAFAAERVAARLGDGADDAAQRAAVFGLDAGGLHLHFLQVLEHGVLARLAVDQAVGHDAVDGEGVLGAAGAVDLKAAFDVAGVDRRRRQSKALEAASLRQAVELLGR